MEDYADIYYVDSRNAVIRDHTTGTTTGSTPRPFGPFSRPMHPSRTVWVPSGNRQPAAPYVPPYAAPYTTPQVIYTQPPQSTAAMLFGRLTTGQVVEMVAQIFAALQSLPSSPAATKDTSQDVANLILYQGALAQHAKRDEQVRTLGSLVARLVG